MIIITGFADADGAELAIKGDAWDYIEKPLTVGPLTLALQRALQYRKEKVAAQCRLTLDRKGRTVTIGKNFIDLTPSEFELLAVLMAAPGRAFTRTELLDRLQGTSFEGYERTIDVHVRNLRIKIEPDDSKPMYIETVYGTGYRFAPQR